MIRITSKKEGFRRCGVAHPARAKDYPDNRWSGEELARLRADPNLVVEIIADPAPPTAKVVMEPEPEPAATVPPPKKGKKTVGSE